MASEDETVSLIGSDKVQGTAVFDADGNKIGSIDRVMIEKTSGRVSYAVLSFGGFLGIGDDHYPLPWPSLKYNVELGGYQTWTGLHSFTAPGTGEAVVETALDMLRELHDKH